MNKLFLLLLFLFIIISCKKDIYNNLDHSKWFSYKVNDTIIYKSSTNADTFVINDITNNYDIIDKTVYNEQFFVYYYSLPENKIASDLCFERFHDGLGLLNKFYKFSDLSTITYALNDTLLDEIYHVSIEIENPSDQNVKSVYYSHRYGIIRYDMTNDKIFELQLK